MDIFGMVIEGTKNVQSLFQLLEENSNYYKNKIYVSFLSELTLKDYPYSKEEKSFLICS